MEATFKIDGEKEVFKNLATLEKELQAKFLIQAARTTLNRLAKDARTRVDKDTGTLQKSIQTDTRIYEGGSVLYGIIGINSRTKGQTEDGELRKPIKYAHIVEFYKPFMRPAWEANKNKIQPVFEKLIQNKVNKALKGR